MRSINVQSIAGWVLLGFLLQIALTSMTAMAADPDPLQDFCVADLASPITLNGYPCKDPANVTASDFVYHGLGKAGDTSTYPNSNVTAGNVHNFPGVNTLGLTIARIDYAANGGLLTPHTHPRSSEMLYVESGALYAGWVSTDNKLYAANLQKGDVLMIPRGLLHFSFNVGTVPAVGIAALNSQDAGFQAIAASLLTFPDNLLEKTFDVNQATIDYLKDHFKG